MNAYESSCNYRVRVTYVSNNIDRLFGFISGVSATALIGVIVWLVFMGQPVTWMGASVAIAALVTLLLLRGVPIDTIRIGDKVNIEFDIRDGSDK